MINSPNEIYVIKNLSKKAEYTYDNVNNKEVETIKVRGHIIHVKSNSQIILLVTEDMKFVTIKKKTMTLIREFNFHEKIPSN